MIVLVDKGTKAKGYIPPHEVLGCPAGTLDTDTAGHRVVVFHFSEVKGRIGAVMAATERVARTGAVIVNNILRVDIGNKAEAFKWIYGIRGLAFPRFWRIREEEVLSAVILPAILKKIRATKPGGKAADRLLTTREELKAAYRKLGGELIAVHFIDSRSEEGIYCSARIHFVNNRLIDAWCTPSRQWNVHIEERAADLMAAYNYRFAEWLAGQNVQAMLDDLYAILGPGWYVMDCVWDGTALWFSEIGYRVAYPRAAQALRQAGLYTQETDTEGIYKIIREAMSTL